MGWRVPGLRIDQSCCAKCVNSPALLLTVTAPSELFAPPRAVRVSHHDISRQCSCSAPQVLQVWPFPAGPFSSFIPDLLCPSFHFRHLLLSNSPILVVGTTPKHHHINNGRKGRRTAPIQRHSASPSGMEEEEDAPVQRPQVPRGRLHGLHRLCPVETASLTL